MRDSGKGRKKPIKTVEPLRPHKARLERLRRVGTKHKKAEDALYLSEKEWEATFNAMSDWVVLLDLESRILHTNRIGEKFTGISPAEIVGQSCCKLVHGSEKHIPTCPLQEMLRTGQRATAELQVPDTSRWLMVTTDPVTDEKGNIIRVVHIVRDITEHKRVEKKLLDYQVQLKSLASELLLTEERERRRIAAELHDRISQSLVISKVRLELLRESAPSKKLAKALDEVCNLLGQAIAEARSLTFDLSFPILYELGFESAVAEWLVKQIQEKHGIATEFEDDEQPKPLDDDIRDLLFRDVRELLINVVKHAHAEKVKVSIRKVGSQIHVSVEDDGAGFDPAEVEVTAAKNGGFGLFSIRGRLEQIGGHIEIESEPGHGTRVTVMAPLKHREITDGE